MLFPTWNTAWHLALLTRPGVDIVHRPNRSGIGRRVRYASCDFSGQELQKQISHIDQVGPTVRESVGVCDMRLVIVWPRATTANIIHGPTVRESVGVRYASCDSMAKSYNSRYRNRPTVRNQSVHDLAPRPLTRPAPRPLL